MKKSEPLNPGLQGVLDMLDKELEVTRNKFNQAYERGDDRAIEQSETKLNRLRRGRDEVVVILQDMQATINKMNS